MMKWFDFERNQGSAEILLAETAKTLESQPVRLRAICIIGSLSGRLNFCSKSIVLAGFQRLLRCCAFALRDTAMRREFEARAVEDEVRDF